MMFFQLSSSYGFDYTAGIWVVNVQSQKLSTLANLITVISCIGECNLRWSCYWEV